jgi:AcrR family transcriptional regulator
MPVNPPSSARSRASLRGAVAEVFRRAILDSAEKVFRSEGFADAKMAKIARGAGVAAGTIYNYFDSKDSIFRALLEQRAEELWTRLQAIAAEAVDPRERLVRLTEATFAHMEEHVPMRMVFEQRGLPAAQALRRACGPGADRMRTRYLQFFETIFADAVRAGVVRKELPLGEITLVFCGSVYGFLRGWDPSRKGRLRDRAAFLVDLFLEGAGTRT